MATSVDSYADRYNKKRQNHQNLRFKQKQYSTKNVSSGFNSQMIINQLNQKASKIQTKQLQQKINQIDLKMTSLTNIVKLVQKYTQTQDQQYQKQRQNLINLESILQGHISQQQKKNQKQQVRLYEISCLYQKFKQELAQLKRQKQLINPETIRQNIELFYNKNKGFRFQKSQQIDNKEILDKRDQKIRTQINKKIQICMEQIQNIPSKQQIKRYFDQIQKKYQKSIWSNAADDVSINRQIQTIKNTLQTIMTEKQTYHRSIPKKERSSQKNIKYLKLQEFKQFKQQLDNKFKHIVQKFSNVVKKYVGRSISPIRKESQKQTNSVKQTLRRNHSQHQNSSRENIHPNIQIKHKQKIRSKSKSSKQIKGIASQKPKSQSKSRKSKSLSKNSSRSSKLNMKQKRLCQKRKQKQQQLREMIKKTKEHKQKLKGKRQKIL